MTKELDSVTSVILTYKVKHGHNFDLEMRCAKQVAQYALEHRNCTSKDVKRFGLKSAISNQIIRKYSKNYLANKVDRVKLTIPGQSVQMIDGLHGIFYIPCLGLTLRLDKMNQLKHVSQVNHLQHLTNLSRGFKTNVLYRRIRRVELDHTYAYISVDVETLPQKDSSNSVGVLITPRKSGLYLYAACKETGKVIKCYLGEKKKVNVPLLHQASRKLINFAVRNRATIKMKDYNSQGRPQGSTMRAMLRADYHERQVSAKELQRQIEYKAALSGVPLKFVPLDEMIGVCSKCGNIGMTTGHKFTCLSCGHNDTLEVNAAFNVSCR